LLDEDVDTAVELAGVAAEHGSDGERAAAVAWLRRLARRQPRWREAVDIVVDALRAPTGTVDA
jgi:hypothetical protein